MAEKLALVDKDSLLKFLNRETNPLPPSNPILTEMKTINEELETTLGNNNESDRIKTRKVNNLIAKHDILKKNGKINNISSPCQGTVQTMKVKI